MPLRTAVVLDLSELDTTSLLTAGLAIASVQMCRSQGKKVIAVVAPTRPRESKDLAEANRLGPTAVAAQRAALVAAGALEASELFVNALREAGLSASGAGPSERPVTRGHLLDAEPRRVSAAAYSAALTESDVLVIPGGVGRDEDDQLTSLGASTGPLTALFIADRLALPVLCPQRADPERESPADNRAVTGLGARKAERFSERCGIEARALQVPGTRAGAAIRPDRFAPSIAIFGSNRAGELFARWLNDLDPDANTARYDADADGAAALIADEPNIVIDVSAAPGPAYTVGSWALRSGRQLITMNPALLAERGGGLSVSALIGGGVLRASGAVVGCPALAAILARSVDWPGVNRVQGTFSPAGDRILDLRAQGMSYERAQAIAGEELGLSPAEVAESATGDDAMRTLAVIATLAFNTPATVRAKPRGAEHVSDADIARAASHGRRYRIVATTERIGDRVSIRVGPVPVRGDDQLINDTPGSVEAIVETRTGEIIRASGRLHQPGGAAAALLNDYLQTRRDPSPVIHAVPADAPRVLGITA